MTARTIFLAALGFVVLAAPGLANAAPKADRYVVVLKEAVDSEAVAKLHGNKHGFVADHVYGHALHGYSAVIRSDRLAELQADENVNFIAEDRELSIDAQSLPTGIDRIDGETSTALSGNGSGTSTVGVAVIDTGIDTAHPDLNVAGGRNCSTGSKSAYNDGNGHGTHVAGTIAAKDDTNGVVGVVPGAPLYAVRVLNNSGSGSTSTVVCGIDWVTANAATKGIKVANMSLGGGGSDDGNCGNSNGDVEHKAICNSVAQGVTYVVAAGNDGADLKTKIPASYDEVLTTTALADFNGQPGGGAASTCRADVDETAADFSNWATLAADQNHTIAAPGVCILSTWKGGSYNTISGTSMASPHMAGVAALCIGSGACTGAPATIIQKLRSDAASYNSANPGYGFTGDPRSPVAGRYYGYLTRASY